MPVAKQRLGVALAVDIGRVEDVAPRLEERVEQDRAGSEVAEILEAKRDEREPLRQSVEGPPLDRLARLELPPDQRVGAASRLLDLVFEPGRSAPVIERAGVAETVGPGHAGRREFLLSGADRLGRRRRSRRNRDAAWP